MSIFKGIWREQGWYHITGKCRCQLFEIQYVSNSRIWPDRGDLRFETEPGFYPRLCRPDSFIAECCRCHRISIF